MPPIVNFLFIIRPKKPPEGENSVKNVLADDYLRIPFVLKKVFCEFIQNVQVHGSHLLYLAFPSFFEILVGKLMHMASNRRP